MTLRRPLPILVAALTVLAAAYSAYWFHVAGTLRKGLDEWAARVGAQWDKAETSGFPFRLTLTLTAPRLTVNGTGWQADAVTAQASPFDLTRITVSAPGHHHLTSAHGDVELTAETLTALVRLDLAGRLEDVAVTGDGIASSGWQVGRIELSVTPLAPAIIDHQTATLQARLAARELTLAEDVPAFLGRTIGLVDLAAQWKGALPVDARPRSLKDWAASGGTIELTRLGIEWGKLALDGEGTLALDPAGQPLAALSTRVRGLPVLLDQLAEAGLIQPDAANAMKFLLMMLSKPDAQGRPAINAPVTLQDGAVFLGPALLTRIPPIIWPEE
ncbi:DUF2125 domain-containing protein [Magnetospirillum moscoviense]|uniref:DUF2125 domain-containing protein n=1 Tax=Magnetospirillum moscoviense TaxID=1437059 RepID=A0A178MUN1_9PROT|nr:DUF2125 domain-containing protein [Magnetospirillum moscoviense]OAN53991.1 hypothetical protein A6A05_09265 [Magnetospirillum moscoviense]